MIEDFAKLIPAEMMERSGAVFYSGSAAFTGRRPLYMLGINPGGDAFARPDENVRRHTASVLTKNVSNWSEYRDESWLGAAPGTSGLQPRVLHLISSLGLDPGEVPASNIVFQRSTRVDTIDGNILELAAACWPVHEAVINQLGIRVVLCFGKVAGSWVRKQLGANRIIAEFVEKNNRQWKSKLFTGHEGIMVIVATHPSRADWTAPSTDPTGLVKEALRIA